MGRVKPGFYTVGAVAAFSNKAIKSTKDILFGDRYTDCLSLYTESRLKNRATTGVAKKFWSLK
jgi:hypothetical protein